MSAFNANDEYPSPDWVMIGCAMPGGGVRILASKDMTTAELRCRVDFQDYTYAEFAPIEILPTSKQYTLQCEMWSVTIIHAKDYASAFQGLFRTWSPEPEPRTEIGQTPALPSPVRAVEGGYDV